MAKVVARKNVTVELTQEEINTLTVALGDTNFDNVKVASKGHSINVDSLAETKGLYKFFLSLSESSDR